MELIFILLGFFTIRLKACFYCSFSNAILDDVLRMNGIVIVLIIFFILCFYFRLFLLFTTLKFAVITRVQGAGRPPVSIPSVVGIC